MSLRLGTHDVEFINSASDGNLIGLALGWDFTAEHGFGIESLYCSFGVPFKSEKGLKGRQITECPKYLQWVTRPNFEGLYAIRDGDLSWLPPRPHFDIPEPKALQTAWDNESFYALTHRSCLHSDCFEYPEIKRACGHPNRQRLWTLYEAFQRLDIAIWLSGDSNPFSKNGLCIGIASKIPQEAAEAWLRSDIAEEQLQEDFKATGILKLLKDAGKKWFTLRPQRLDDGSLRFWLTSMMDSSINKNEWYSLKELQQWAEGKGPVIRKKSGV